MLMTKNGVIYSDLTKSLIEGIISTIRSPFCIVERELTYETPEIPTSSESSEDDDIGEFSDGGFGDIYLPEYIDDITTEEVDKGTIKVVEFLSSIKEYDLIDRYNEFLVSEGYTPKEPEVTKITLRQAKLILNKKDLLSNIENCINSIPDEKLKQAALIEWEYANEVDINNPLISVVKQVLKLSDDEVKAIFREASGL